MQCKEWDDANSELFKESHDEAVHKNSYKSRLYELISASLRHHHNPRAQGPVKHRNLKNLRGEAPSTILYEPSESFAPAAFDHFAPFPCYNV